MRAHQPGSTPIDIPESVPNPAYTPRPAPAPAPEREPTKAPEKVPEKTIAGRIAPAWSSFVSKLPIGAEMQPTGSLWDQQHLPEVLIGPHLLLRGLRLLKGINPLNGEA
jgi:hypothetical protein